MNCPECAEAIAPGTDRCPFCDAVLVARPPTGGSGYDVLADKVGFVPNVRWKDNLFQLVFVLVTTLGAAGLGLVLADRPGDRIVYALGLALVGLLGGVLVSGFVLTIVGLARKS